MCFLLGFPARFAIGISTVDYSLGVQEVPSLNLGSPTFWFNRTAFFGLPSKSLVDDLAAVSSTEVLPASAHGRARASNIPNRDHRDAQDGAG